MGVKSAVNAIKYELIAAELHWIKLQLLQDVIVDSKFYHKMIQIEFCTIDNII